MKVRKLRKQIVRLWVGAGAALALLGTASQARADCSYIYQNGVGESWHCTGSSTQYTWKPCNVSAVSFNILLWSQCFSACIDSACQTSDPNGSLNNCMLNNGSPWSCGTCP